MTGNPFAHCDTWDELTENVQQALRTCYFDGTRPDRIRLHLVLDERLALRWGFAGNLMVAFCRK